MKLTKKFIKLLRDASVYDEHIAVKYCTELVTCSSDCDTCPLDTRNFTIFISELEKIVNKNVSIDKV